MSKRGRGPNKPPTNPKREEIPVFSNLVNNMAVAAGTGQRFLERSEPLLKELDELKGGDGNKWTRFLSFLNGLSDYSEKQLERDGAQIALLQDQLRGSKAEPGEDIDKFRSWKQIEEYCEKLDNFDPRDHATLADAKEALKEHFSVKDD